MALPTVNVSNLRYSIGNKAIMSMERTQTRNWNFSLLIKQLRPGQWLKNLLIFVVLFFSVLAFPIDISLEPRFLKSVIGFVAFCLISSSIYIIKDYLSYYLDRMYSDEKHSLKVSKTLNHQLAPSVAACLLIGSLAIGFYVNVVFTLILLFYFLLNVIYSLYMSINNQVLHYNNKSIRLQREYKDLQTKYQSLDKEIGKTWLAIPYPGLRFSALDMSKGLSGNWKYEVDDTKWLVSTVDSDCLLVDSKMADTDKLYIISNQTGFSHPPSDIKSWRLLANTEFKVQIDVEFISGPPLVDLWIFEYSDQERLDHIVFSLKQGTNEFQFFSSEKTSCFKAAFRITKEGKVKISPIQIFWAIDRLVTV